MIDKFCSNELTVSLSKAPPLPSLLEVGTESTALPQNGKDLTEEEMEMLFEEPEMITTNAMRAVQGYDPQDDRRLCPHYDPKTGGCWKGNTCRFEHGPKMEDGWTSDRKVSTITLANDVCPLVGSTYKVCVTCIRSADDFFVHIPEISAQFNPPSLLGLKNQMNVPDMVKQYKPCTENPSN